LAAVAGIGAGWLGAPGGLVAALDGEARSRLSARGDLCAG